jgi:hypothetical protein
MSKRTRTLSKITRPRDEWDTPPEATAVLARLLPPGTSYVEPCAGRGALIDAMSSWGHTCVFASDIAPRAPGIVELSGDATEYWPAAQSDTVVVTNPPYTRNVVIPLLEAWMEAAQEIHLLVRWTGWRTSGGRRTPPIRSGSSRSAGCPGSAKARAWRTRFG